MGRTAAFDRDAVIAQARDLFWEKGYENTAVPELEQATGLRRSSLYHSFGSKKALFELAVQSYLNEKVRPLLVELQEPKASADALVRYLQTVRSSITANAVRPDCLLIASANAPIGSDPTVAAVIADYYAELLAAFTSGVRAARPELPHPQQESLSKALVALNITALTLARTNPELAQANIDTALSQLDELKR